uniref:C-type lectin domain-containing protein n=1 Tax=Haplochromis burtoni TaxID=8153 RepID=A0A3Q2VJZ1_HAPBU
MALFSVWLLFPGLSEDDLCHCVVGAERLTGDVVCLSIFIRKADDQSLNWYEAFQKCRQTYTDLANIQGPANNSEAQQAASGGHIWIGLFRNMWKWSQTGLVQSSWFQNWALNEPGTGQCVIISQFGVWSTRDCTVQNHFICYSGELFLNSPTSASNKVYRLCCT